MAVGLRPDPLGELMRASRPHRRNGGLLLRGEKEGQGGEGGDILIRGREEKGPTSKGDGEKGRSR